jgi:hypothetical protein
VKRLIMHCGLPKTGTSAVQALFWLNRALWLRKFGVLYPELIKSPREPRHVFLQEELIRDLKFEGLRGALEEADRTHARTVVISSEGLSGQSFLFDRSRASEFLELTRDWKKEFLFVTREKTSWLTSRYRQHIVNPPQPLSSRSLEQLHATGLPFKDWVRNCEIHNQSDPDIMRLRFQSLFGQIPTKFISYGPTVVRDVLAAVGVDEDIEADDLPYINTMPPDAYVEVLRRINCLPCGRRLNNAAAAAIRSAVGTNNVQLAQRPEPGRGSLLLLAATVCTLKWSPNPPLDVTLLGFKDARFRVAKAALRMATGPSKS